MENRDKKILISIAKSMQKAFKKALNYNEDKINSKDVVSDVLDENMKPEADKDKIPFNRTGVLHKKYTSKDVAKKVTEKVLEKYKKHKKQSLIKR